MRFGNAPSKLISHFNHTGVDPSKLLKLCRYSKIGETGEGGGGVVMVGGCGWLDVECTFFGGGLLRGKVSRRSDQKFKSWGRLIHLIVVGWLSDS
jgi:hypothetical protein